MPKKRPSKFVSNNLFSRCGGIRNRHLDTGITAYLLSICCTAALEIQSVHDYNHSTLADRLLDASTIPDHTAHRHSPSVHFWQNQDFPFPWFSRTTNNSSFVSVESSRTKFCKQKCKILIRSSLCSTELRHALKLNIFQIANKWPTIGLHFLLTYRSFFCRLCNIIFVPVEGISWQPLRVFRLDALLSAILALQLPCAARAVCTALSARVLAGASRSRSA